MNLKVELKKLADLPFYTEGPVVDNKGNFYCTTLTGGNILKINANNKLTEWARSTCPNGQLISPDGDHLICDSKLAAVRRFDEKGSFVKDEIRGFCAGKPVSSPNDLVMDSKGGIYFTDSIRHTGSVFYIGKDGEESVLTTNLDYPNGLVLSHDERFLYVAESYVNKIVKINITQETAEKEIVVLFSNLPAHTSGREQDNLPDGLAIDNNHNLLVAHYGMQAIQVLSQQGNLLGSIDTKMVYTSNLTFVDNNTILATGGYGEPGPGAIFLIRISEGL